ncbi:hypothetical protein EGW08_019943 [Elysia chlorotica]|uniref:Sulfotransferase domain-containing protein n=1 Tax=Elysia chlorotica TaxID=188477 RepID=A0A433SSR1_ELYCH|nr:hypothetical protein EGW08_019943 [Elysia chlorotica]
MSSSDAQLVPDAAGRTMELIRAANGRYMATDYVRATVENLAALPLREDDIMLCSYPKSGCHWLWECIRYLVFGGSDIHKTADKESSMIELNTREYIEALKSPRVLNNHAFFDEQPSDLKTKGVKVVFVYRNIKDVAVSYYYHHTRDKTYKYSGTFSQYLQRFESGLVDSGSVYEYLHSWENGIMANPSLKVHVLSYEEMTEDPVRELRRLNDFLGTNRDGDFLQMVAMETSLDAMILKKNKITTFIDENGLPIMYRKGKVGDWMNHFNSDEREKMDKNIAKELGKSKLFKFKDTSNS